MDIHTPWDARIALDLFLGGAGVGLLLFAVALIRVNSERYGRLILSAAYLSPTLVLMGMLLLMTELGRPLQAYVMMASFNTSSLTAWGTVVQSAFIGIGFMHALLLHKEYGFEIRPAVVKKILDWALSVLKGVKLSGLLSYVRIIGIILAIFIGFYHGTLLASMGRPLWTGVMVPILFLNSSLLASAAVLALLNRFLISRKVAGVSSIQLERVMVGLAALQLALMLGWYSILNSSGKEVLQAAQWMFSRYGMLLYGGATAVGLLVPMALSLVFVFRRKPIPPRWEMTLCSLFIIGGLVFKYVVIMAGQANFSVLD